MSYDTPPRNLTALNKRMKNLEGVENLLFRRRTTMALVVVRQMLPEGAVKGGSAMALRYGSGTRFTRDLDAARAGDLEIFRADFEESLRKGWGGFTGRLVERTPPNPPAIPASYVMKPFDVKLDYEGKSWCRPPDCPENSRIHGARQRSRSVSHRPATPRHPRTTRPRKGPRNLYSSLRVPKGPRLATVGG